MSLLDDTYQKDFKVKTQHINTVTRLKEKEMSREKFNKFLKLPKDLPSGTPFAP